jgi:hypothetical protein
LKKGGDTDTHFFPSSFKASPQKSLSLCIDVLLATSLARSLSRNGAPPRKKEKKAPEMVCDDDVESLNSNEDIAKQKI